VNKQSAPRRVRCALAGALVAPAAACFCGGAALDATASVPPATLAPTLTVGQLTLKRCEPAQQWCTTLVRPLDPHGGVPGTIAIYFEYYPHRGSGPAAGTLVAAEGGPGYPATDSRDSYLALFGSLRRRYDVVIMDYRGTGRSGAIDCKELQSAPELTEGNIGSCGRSLGAAAPLYSTALASDDLAAILDALAIERVGLYANSYGTYFAQVFALRHRDKVRSLVLDGADLLDGPDFAWYPHYAPAMRDKFNLACARSSACAAVGGTSLDHIAPALERLRAHPFEAAVRYGDGRTLKLTANATALAIVMFGGSPAFATLRETDAAARAFVAGDTQPLLRLMAETAGSVDSRDPTRNPVIFSAGLAAAVSCLDPPQIFDMYLAPAQRLAARDALIEERKAQAPATYAPFTIDEYRAMPLDYAFIDQCVEWPSPSGYPPSPLTFPAASYPDVPVLVVSGELDNMTPVADGAAVAAHFPRSHHLVLANSFHVNALPHARSACAAQLVRRFLDTLASGDDSCARSVPAVRLVAAFARRAHELAPAQAARGNHARTEALRVVTAAWLTAEDAISRSVENGAGKGVGLRGGSFTAAATRGGYGLVLHELQWTDDVSASGRIDWPGRTGTVRATLYLQSPQGTGTLELSWPEGASGARATARGRLGGKTIVAQGPAP
jgi:pimeloyl-ACP methyl ester carboxylesterase